MADRGSTGSSTSPEYWVLIGLSVAFFVFTIGCYIRSSLLRNNQHHRNTGSVRRKSSKVDVRDYPAQVVIAGAVGKTANDGNGVFIRTKEDMNGCALYIKAAAEESSNSNTDYLNETRWLWYMAGSTPTWVVTTDSSKQANGTGCLWYSIDAASPFDPPPTTGWHIATYEGFEFQSSITVTFLEPSSIPATPKNDAAAASGGGGAAPTPVVDALQQEQELSTSATGPTPATTSPAEPMVPTTQELVEALAAVEPLPVDVDADATGALA